MYNNYSHDNEQLRGKGEHSNVNNDDTPCNCMCCLYSARRFPCFLVIVASIYLQAQMPAHTNVSFTEYKQKTKKEEEEKSKKLFKCLLLVHFFGYPCVTRLMICFHLVRKTWTALYSSLLHFASAPNDRVHRNNIYPCAWVGSTSTCARHRC